MTLGGDGIVSMTLKSGRVLKVSRSARGWWRAVALGDPQFEVVSPDTLELRGHAERLDRLAQKIRTLGR